MKCGFSGFSSQSLIRSLNFIPHLCFSLEVILLNNNRISEIAANTFARLANLSRVELVCGAGANQTVY